MSNRIPIALQLYSVRDDCAGDLSLTLQAVAQMGYEGVEFAGYYDRTAEELRDMCEDLGLKVAGTHTGINTLLGDELAETLEFNKILGNPYLIVPGLSEEYRNSNRRGATRQKSLTTSLGKSRIKGCLRATITTRVNLSRWVVKFRGIYSVATPARRS